MSREMWLLVVLAGLVALATLVGAVLLAVRVVRTRRLLGALGAGGKVAFYGALIYTILPVDLLPDPIYLDDMGVLAGALVYLGRLAARHRAAQGALPGQTAQRGLPGSAAQRGLPDRTAQRGVRD
ncbi:YkvA family protein [Micromonospora sp. NPDC050495]|uniref:YkvA family protein n=1 Tax=Micromonospora sp. NPDC050495 TaxID=3154936 RepID=UPI0033D8BB34